MRCIGVDVERVVVGLDRSSCSGWGGNGDGPVGVEWEVVKGSEDGGGF